MAKSQKKFDNRYARIQQAMSLSYGLKHFIQKVPMLHFCVVFFAGIGFTNLSPFGYSDLTEKLTQRIIVALSAPFFPLRERHPDFEPVVVAEISNHTLNEIATKKCETLKTKITDDGADIDIIKTLDDATLLEPLREPVPTRHHCQRALIELQSKGRTIGNTNPFEVPLTIPSQTWPLSYDLYDYIIAELVKMEPAAIMVDITFGPARYQDPSLTTFGSRTHQ